jgi:hypothetical protein
MMSFSRARRFAKVIDFHSSGREVLQTYLCTPMPPAIENFIDAEAGELAGLASYGVRQPSAEGEHQQWQTAEVTSYAFLVETQTTFQPAYSAAVAEAALVWPLVERWLQRPIPLRGHVVDAVTGLPVEADITAAGAAWQAGETRRSHPGTGSYHLFLPPGPRTITWAAPGYQSVTTTLVVPDEATLVHDVQLGPAFLLELSTTGAGDLHVGVRNIPSLSVEGYSIVSTLTAQPVGTGPLAGLQPDLLTFQLLTLPAVPGGLFHWTWPVPLPLFPAGDFDVPPGVLSLPPGFAVDALAVALGAGAHVLAVSPVVRVIF